MIELLLKYGADSYIQGYKPKTGYEYANKNRRYDVINLTIKTKQ